MMCPGRCWGATEGRCKSDSRRVFSEYCVRGTVPIDCPDPANGKITGSPVCAGSYRQTQLPSFQTAVPESS
jgi:hypothetical protein